MRLDIENVDEICAAVDTTVGKPVIDLSEIDFVEPYGLVYLGMFIRYHSGGGKLFEVVPPRSDQVKRYLKSQQFLESYGISLPGDFGGTETQMAQFTSLRGMIDIKNSQYIAEEVGEMVGEVLEKNKVVIKGSLVTEIVVELVDNFSLHSDEHMAACAMQLYPALGRLDFAIGDCGVGIRQSLIRNPKYKDLADTPHQEVAVKALEFGVSGREGGTGFGTIQENLSKLEGRMFLSTGDGWVHVGGDQDDIQFGTMNNFLTGVQIEVSIPVGGR